MTRQFLNGKRLTGTLLAGAAVATCLAIGAERVVAFGFRGGGGFHGVEASAAFTAEVGSNAGALLVAARALATAVPVTAATTPALAKAGTVTSTAPAVTRITLTPIGRATPSISTIPARNPTLRPGKTHRSPRNPAPRRAAERTADPGIPP